MLRIIQRRLGKIPIRYALIFTLLNSIFLLLFRHIIVRVAAFLICAILLYKFGKLPYADIDPVPFFSSLIYLWYGYPVAFQFIVWTVPVTDVFSGRLSQFTLVNFISLGAALSIISIFSLPVAYVLLVTLGLFNLIRLVINLSMGSGMNSLIAPATNLFVYFIIISLASPIVESTTWFFRSIVL